jgi:hypothetical protein
MDRVLGVQDGSVGQLHVTGSVTISRVQRAAIVLINVYTALFLVMAVINIERDAFFILPVRCAGFRCNHFSAVLMTSSITLIADAAIRRN